jgi:hypothetical protein
MKIIGLIMTWNNLHYFKCAIKQILDFCDEVIVVEGCHLTGYPPRSTDGTCEYIEKLHGPKLKIIQDFKLEKGRYDTFQCKLREKYAKESKYWKPGNWILQWDDDIAFFDEDIPKIRHAMKTTSCDTIRFRERRFAYNFRLNVLADKNHLYGIRWQRITKGCYYTPVSHLHYKNGGLYVNKVGNVLNMSDIIYHHYPYVKPTSRVKARWNFSANKGAISNSNLYLNTWNKISWKKDEDVLKQESNFRQIVGNKGKINVYSGKHPEIMDEHPWRYINDIRSCT